jgi:hypothetical protein
MYMWTVHMHTQKFLPSTKQSFVPGLGRLSYDIIVDGIAHPPRACDYNCTKGGVRVWDVPQERLVEGVVEAREALFVGGRGAGALARDWDLDALEYDGHVLRKKAKRRRA